MVAQYLQAGKSPINDSIQCIIGRRQFEFEREFDDARFGIAVFHRDFRSIANCSSDQPFANVGSEERNDIVAIGRFTKVLSRTFIRCRRCT